MAVGAFLLSVYLEGWWLMWTSKVTNCRTNCVTSTELSLQNSAKDQLPAEKHKRKLWKPTACLPPLLPRPSPPPSKERFANSTSVGPSLKY